MKVPLIAIFLVALGFPVLRAQDDTPAADVAAEVNRNLSRFKTIEHSFEPKEGEEPYLVTAWLSDGVFRKVKASQKGDGGLLARDFIYDIDGHLKFALASLTGEAKEGAAPSVVEERFEFKADKLVSYVGPDGKPVAPGDEDFVAMEKALVALSANLIERIEGSTAYQGMATDEIGKAPSGTVFGAGYSDGIFSGTEQGDYLHLDISQADGSVETFFVVTRDDSIDAIVKDVSGSKGKRIRVHWVERMQALPEAGEPTRLKICQRIEVLP